MKYLSTFETAKNGISLQGVLLFSAQKTELRVPKRPVTIGSFLKMRKSLQTRRIKTGKYCKKQTSE